MSYVHTLTMYHTGYHYNQERSVLVLLQKKAGEINNDLLRLAKFLEIPVKRHQARDSQS